MVVVGRMEEVVLVGGAGLDQALKLKAEAVLVVVGTGLGAGGEAERPRRSSKPVEAGLV